MGLDTDRVNAAVGIAVVETRLDALEERLEAFDQKMDERHDATLERHATILKHLEQIAETLPPLRAKVEAMEKLKGQVMAVAAALSAVAGGMAWVVQALGR